MKSENGVSITVSKSVRSNTLNRLLILVVLAIELLATYASVTGEPLNPVDHWIVTRETDWMAFVLVFVGCVSLFWQNIRPTLALIITTLSYCAYILSDYELGLFLPVMLILYTSVANGHSRIWPFCMAMISFLVSLFWVYQRLIQVNDSGVIMFAWVAFGAVFAVFFIAPLLIGEIVYLRRKK
ncbi:hypothetical protein [Halalkalibacter sp. APA_J-10(15)]|uniref:hypothetical protein n=1 Tax=Halalkalibacter sp. APA_J-10(15) TaxID=2933805 RepID=UPI001FF2BF82|nr:hypothetical protein [Halalkalibacter sp. APA_J-10(15)]MCK0469891.1 hypothetical protein [Halalkalibacter sp. APA_J-10(15)]